MQIKYMKKRNIVSPFRETTQNTFFVFFQFRVTIETRRNSDLFRTVSYFAKLKNTNLSVSTLVMTHHADRISSELSHRKMIFPKT